MASNITLSAGVRQNLLSLQNTSNLMATTQNRLATGKKVNSALDNPSNFFTSSSLSARAGDLSSLLDSMSNGIKTLETADNGLKSITKTVESMQATVRQARQDKSWQGTSYTIDSTAIGTAGTKNLTISGGAVTGTVTLDLNTAASNGTKASLSTTGAYAAPTAAAAATLTGGGAWAVQGAGETSQLDITYGGVVGTLSVTITEDESSLTETIDKINSAILTSDFNGKIKAQANAGKLEIVALANEDATLAVDETLSGAGTSILADATDDGSNGLTEFTVNGTAVSVGVSDGANVDAAVNSINLQLSAASSEFEAFNDTGKLGIREKAANGTVLTLAGTDSGLFTALTNGSAANAGTNGSVKSVDTLVNEINANGTLAGKVKASNDGGKLRIENLSTADLSVVGASSTAVTGGTGPSSTQTIKGNEVRKNLISQFNDLRDQLDKFANDASFNGINLLKGDKLSIVLNETNTSSIEIKSTNASGVSVSTLSIGAADATEFRDDASLDARLNGLSTSLSTLRSQSSTFGSNLSIVQNRQEFTKSMISTLQTGADNLVLADSNEEAANLLALQTRQQLSSTALSLASQADQAVLRLF
jgi:flagellin-like hook-associated protein FlgL